MIKNYQFNIVRRKSGAGFTLIELLVVIAVIGLLASVVMVALNSVRAKARDTRRMADISQLQKAIELYYQDNGTYPNISQLVDNNLGCVFGTGDPLFTDYLSAYMSSNPHDPQTSLGIPYCYIYNVKNSGQGYVVMAYHVELPATAAKGDGAACFSDIATVYCKGINFQ